jgi:hypothetical protein
MERTVKQRGDSIVRQQSNRCAIGLSVSGNNEDVSRNGITATGDSGGQQNRGRVGFVSGRFFERLRRMTNKKRRGSWGGSGSVVAGMAERRPADLPKGRA